MLSHINLFQCCGIVCVYKEGVAGWGRGLQTLNPEMRINFSQMNEPLSQDTSETTVTDHACMYTIT